jgi:hypothetical protein
MKHDCNHHPVQRPEEIAALISRYRASGLALKDFAREQGLPAGRLHYWLYQKHRPAAPTRSGVAFAPPGGSPRRSPFSGAPAFQEVKLATGVPLLGSWAAEISLPRGMAVRFSTAAQPGWIGAVVQALQRPC